MLSHTWWYIASVLTFLAALHSAVRVPVTQAYSHQGSFALLPVFALHTVYNVPPDAYIQEPLQEKTEERRAKL